MKTEFLSSKEHCSRKPLNKTAAFIRPFTLSREQRWKPGNGKRTSELFYQLFVKKKKKEEEKPSRPKHDTTVLPLYSYRYKTLLIMYCGERMVAEEEGRDENEKGRWTKKISKSCGKVCLLSQCLVCLCLCLLGTHHGRNIVGRRKPTGNQAFITRRPLPLHLVQKKNIILRMYDVDVDVVGAAGQHGLGHRATAYRKKNVANIYQRYIRIIYLNFNRRIVSFHLWPFKHIQVGSGCVAVAAALRGEEAAKPTWSHRK